MFGNWQNDYKRYLMPSIDLSRLDLPAKDLILLQALLRQHVPDAQVWAYGSRVSGGAHECSDLDLVLRIPGNLSERVSGMMALKEAVQDSALPILVDIHDWAQLRTDFHHAIEHAYIELQAGTAQG